MDMSGYSSESDATSDDWSEVPSMFSVMFASVPNTIVHSLIARCLAHIVLLHLLAVTGGCDISASSNSPSAGIDTTVSSTPISEEQLTTPAELGSSPNRLAKGRLVSAALRLDQEHIKKRGSIELSVELDIAPMWEIHILKAEPEETATNIELLLPGGVQAIGEWTAPEPSRSSTPNGHEVYADKAVFTRNLEVTKNVSTGKNLIHCEVKYQACNERQCMKPSKLALAIPLYVD